MATNNELVRALSGEPERRPVWPFMLLAVPIAALWGFRGSLDRLPRWDGTIPGRVDQLAGIFGYTLVPALLTWVAFYLLVFRKRCSHLTSIALLAIIVAAAFALPTSILLLATR